MGQRAILIRCDAGAIPEIGTGHLVRGLLLAEQLRDAAGARCVFVVGGDQVAYQQVLDRGFEAIRIDGSDEDVPRTRAAIRSVGPDVVVIDRLGVGHDYIAAIKAEGVLVAVIDHPAAGADEADIRINPVIEAECAVHGGADYAVMRPVPWHRRVAAPVGRRVYASFGGYDRAGLLVSCLRELSSLSPAPAIDAVARASHAERAQLESLAASSDGRIRVHLDVADVRPLLEQADLAVVSGGLTMFESVAHGVPTVVVGQYEHQVAASRRLADAGAAVVLGLGASLSSNILKETVQQLLGDPVARRRLSAAGRAAVDGQGLARTAELVSVVRLLPWDSTFFGFRVGRVAPYVVTEDLLGYADRWARAERIRCLYYLADFGSARSVRLAEEHGYRLVDARVTLTRSVSPDPPAAERVPVRTSRDEDLPALRALTATMFLDSRFYFDEGFPRERCRELYAQWVERLHRDPGGRLFVAEPDGRLAGFIACDRVGGSRGVISLIGVDAQFQGHGVGTALVGRALRWFGEEDLPVAQVWTQARNVGAQQLYQRCGFCTRSTQLWYHKWFAS